MPMTEAKQIVRQIERNAARRKKLEADLVATREAGDQLIVAADAVGVPKLTLSKAARMTRATIYNIILRAEAGR